MDGFDLAGLVFPPDAVGFGIDDLVFFATEDDSEPPRVGLVSVVSGRETFASVVAGRTGLSSVVSGGENLVGV